MKTSSEEAMKCFLFIIFQSFALNGGFSLKVKDNYPKIYKTSGLFVQLLRTMIIYMPYNHNVDITQKQNGKGKREYYLSHQR